MPSLFCSVHSLHQTLPIDPMIKKIYRPSDEPNRIFEVVTVKLTARQHDACEKYMTYYGCSYSAAFNEKFVLL